MCSVMLSMQCLPVWDVDNVMQLWHLPATADPIFVIGIYVSYVWKIALNRIDNIPWTIDCTTFTQRIWKSACDINGNVKLMFDDRVAWQNFCQSSVDKQNVDKAWQRQKKRASSLTSSSSINTRWSSTYFDELTTKRDLLVNRTWWQINNMQLLLAVNSGRNIQAVFATIIEWSCNPIHQRLHKMVICTETKSDILQCLLGYIPVSHTSPETTATVLDDDVIVQMLSRKCGNATTFPYYVESVFIPHLSGFSRING